MKIRRHYLTLRRCYPDIVEDIPLEVTLEELAHLLDCTHRNMVLLLKRMQQEQWLTWSPRRGRGNRSILTFQARREEMLLQEAQEMVEKQDLRSALELVQAAGDSSSSLREHFQAWLSGQFGFHSEVHGHKRLDSLRFPLPQTIHSLDPATIQYTGESHLVNQLFDGLVRMDARGEHIVPHLAHAWETDPTRTLWTFYLRKGVLFHHGREMVSSDAAYSLNRLRKLAPRGLYSWAYEDIVSIETPDDTTLRIRLSERNEVFLAFLTTNRASVVPQDVCVAAGGLLGTSPVGTGPFRMAKQEQGVWILEAFPSYFQGRGFLDRVEVWTMPMTEVSVSEVHDRPQPLQVMHNVRLSDTAAGGWQQVRQSGMTCKFITVNELKDGPAAHADLRAAIDYALDRAFVLDQLSGDVIEANDSFLVRTDSTKPILLVKPDREEIDRRLALAGYQGETLHLATIPQYETDAALVRDALAKVGVAVDIQLIPTELFKGEARMAADLLLFAVMLDEHRELRLIDLYRSMQQHVEPHMQAMLEQHIQLIQTEPDSARRLVHFQEIESQLKQRHSLLFLYRKHLKTAFHPSIRGISLESLGWVRFRDIWFTDLNSHIGQEKHPDD